MTSLHYLTTYCYMMNCQKEIFYQNFIYWYFVSLPLNIDYEDEFKK
jgi:hypothetical protein